MHKNFTVDTFLLPDFPSDGCIENAIKRIVQQSYDDAVLNTSNKYLANHKAAAGGKRCTKIHSAKKKIRNEFFFLAPVMLLFTSTFSFSQSTSTLSFSDGPYIDVWYGENQKFGHLGNPQEWINILGKVSDPDGILSLTYRLNKGNEIPLSIGPDGRRLQHKGDFNIDIATSSLTAVDTVYITATNNSNISTTQKVLVDYTSGKNWPAAYSFSWDTVTNIQDVVQVVDGKWEITNSGIRTSEIGYDRLLAIGDVKWKNYEIVIPVTPHQLASTVGPNAGDYGLGVLMLWKGHTDKPVSGWQPKSGYFPLGDIGWFNWPRNNTDPTKLSFFNDASINFPITTGITYMFKVQVSTQEGSGDTYKLKVWKSGTEEPIDWTMTYLNEQPQISDGSLMLLAHYVDATFGDPMIRPINPSPVLNAEFTSSTDLETNPFQVNFDASLTVDTDNNIRDYTWNFGETGSPEGSGVQVSHTYATAGTYKVTLTVTDADDNVDVIAYDVYISGTNEPFISNNFYEEEVKKEWTFIDPVGHDSATLVTDDDNISALHLSVSDKSSHDTRAESNNTVRMMQPAVNTDFKILVKFESPVEQENKLQGILIEEDAQNYLRFDFHSEGKKTRNYASVKIEGQAFTKYNVPIGEEGMVPLYLLVTRTGNKWRMSWSVDKEVWNTGASFQHSLMVSKVGFFAGNAGNLPAHTCIVNYFLNHAVPPEEPIRQKPPVASKAIPNQETIIDNLYSYTFDTTTFEDANGDSLRFTASLKNGDPLPEWLTFDGAQRKFYGTPSALQTLDIKVTATDGTGTATASFELAVKRDFISDNFDSETLNNFWTFIDPVGDGAAYNKYRGVHLEIQGEKSHDLWTGGNNSARIMQAAPNTDLGIEVKFKSPVTAEHQLQGILIEQDATNYLRFDFHSDNNSTKNFAAAIVNDIGSALSNVPIATTGVAPLYLRVIRRGDVWRMAYSHDGEAWTTTSTFEHKLSVSKVGLFVGNIGEPIPAHTAKVKYFYNMAAPLEEIPNGPPVVEKDIPDQKVIINTSFDFAFDNKTFSDPDGDSLRYSASMADGNSLPDWLSFNATDRHFSGMPTASDTLEIKVIAEDDSTAEHTAFHLYSYDTAQQELPTGLEKFADKAGGIHIYPNPITQKSFFIEFSQGIERIKSLELYDMQGKQKNIITNLYRIRGANNDKVEVDISTLHLPAGVYLLKVISESSGLNVTHLFIPL